MTKMSKSKRMKNNASSALDEQEMVNILINSNSQENYESKDLISKHSGLRKSYLRRSKSPNGSKYVESFLNNGDKLHDEVKLSSTNLTESRSPTISTTFTINRDIYKLMSKVNFPTRFPVKLEGQDTETNVLTEENIEKMEPVSTNDNKMKEAFIKFWNRIITKQNVNNRSVLNHQLTEKEAGYIPCKLKTIFSPPESYLKKPFCEKLRYDGPGHQLLSTPNQFCRSLKRSLIKLEVNQIFSHYSNPNNQYYLIPIELTSKLSRSMLRSVEIAQNTLGCNKINFVCSSQNFAEKLKHPLLTIEYKRSIEEEVLPCPNLSLVNNYPTFNLLTAESVNRSLFKALTNYPYLSHFLHRKDFAIDNFFGKCWHYTRYFCDKLDLGLRVNSTVSVFIKDAIFKYLLSCSVRICIAIKYWVLNPECATYFRCKCGQKMFDVKQESKVLKRYPIGSAQLFTYQQKILDQDGFHRKHAEKKSNLHICACSQQFKDHQSWFNHTLSTKISDLGKICPIVLFNISQSCQDQNRFVCECSHTVSDYDFWSFWIHICNCKVFRKFTRDNCHCSEKSKEYRQHSVTKLPELNGKRAKPIRKRKRSNSNKGEPETGKRQPRKFRKFTGRESLSEESRNKRTDKSTDKKDNEKPNNSERQSGDDINLPLKLSNCSDTQPNKSKTPKRKPSEIIN